MAEIKREPGPAAEFQYPRCGMCGDETDGDGDGFWCEKCGVTYGHDGTFSHWNDEAEQCEARAAFFFTPRHDLPPLPRRCLLGAGHDGSHAHSGDRWRQGVPPYSPDSTYQPNIWRALTPEQADQLQAAYDAFIGRAVSRG